jgi:PAS domain S-box-containing protein
MAEQGLYNSRVVYTYFEYLRKFRPEIDIDKLVSDSGIELYEIEDEGHWLTQKQVDAFHDALMAQSNDPSLFREAGRYMTYSQSLGVIRQFIQGFMSPMLAYLRIPRVAGYVNRSATFEVKKLGLNRVEIITKIHSGIEDKPYQCENRIGSFEAVAQLFTGKLPTVEHTTCVHKGGAACIYVISWDEPSWFKLRRLSNFLSIPLLAISVCCGFFSYPPHPLFAFIVSAALLTGVSYYSQVVEKNDIYDRIHWQGDTANRFLDQITDNYNNSLLIQEVSQAVSNTLDIDRLLVVINETLRKRLNFDRGMIMLADPGRKKLVYAAGYGYISELENTLLNASFNLDNPDSRGPFVTSFLRQKPILVNDINDIKHNFSSRGKEFSEKMGATSFICVPIVYEGISEGILAVDNYKSSRPLGQSGVNMLVGIATQIAISLNNAMNHRKLKESEERFRTLSENSPDVIYTIDNRTVITYANPAVREHLSYSPEEIVGMHFSELVRKEDAGIFSDLFARIIKNHETVRHFDGKLLTRDGVERLFDISSAPNINFKGEMTGIVGILKDITEQRRLEEQLRHTSKMNAIGQLTGGIAHDFNNILQAIGSYTELLRRRIPVTEEADRYVHSIQELTRRATDLVKEMMMFSRKVESRLSPLDLNREIKNCTELLLGTFPKDISIKYDLSENLKPINGDAGQIGQVLLNLAVNAKDAMPNGGTLTIKTENLSLDHDLECGVTIIRPGRYAVLKVADTGSGMDKKTMEHIFEPFFTTKEVGKGTGIGLAVVYGVIKNHGGNISCESEFGKGTVFALYLPALEGPIQVKEHEDISIVEKAGQGETILLVDDEEALLETGEELLSLSGYEVLTASSGEAALDVLEREAHRINLVIMDMMMPGMGGMECLHQVVETFPKLKVIMASGFIEGDRIRGIIDSGATAFIQKPYLIDELKKTIRSALDAGA